MALGIYNEFGTGDDNTAGGVLIALVDAADVINYPFINQGAAQEELQLKEGVAAVPIDLEDLDLELTIDKIQRNGADQFIHTIRFLIPKNRNAVVAALNDWDRKDILLIYQSSNEDYRLLGTPDNPVRFNWKSGYGRNPERSNAYDVSIQWIHYEEAPFYDQDLEIANCGPVRLFLDGVFFELVPCGTDKNVPLNDIFREHFIIENPSMLNRLLNDIVPITIARNLTIESLTDKSPHIDTIEYSLDNATWNDLEAAIPLAIPGGNELYQRVHLSQPALKTIYKLNGQY